MWFRNSNLFYANFLLKALAATMIGERTGLKGGAYARSAFHRRDGAEPSRPSRGFGEPREAELRSKVLKIAVPNTPGNRWR